jgi:RHS repeat-associated protein
MGRPVSLTSNNGPADVMKNMQNDFTAPAPIVQNVQYDYAGRMTSLQYLAGETSTGVGVYTQESMSYNVSGQLASLGWGNPAGQSASNYSAIGAPTGGVGYTWSSTQNNGQITQAVDTISGETITYIYDALKRLTAASSTKPWTQTFQYDGFGNLTAKVLNGASTPIPVNPANNRLSNATYDADGNMTSGAGASMAYDEANRLTSAAETSGGIEYYGYSPDNKRVYHQLANGTGEWIFYSPQGERMGIYTFNSSTGWSTVSTNVWFAGKLMSDENGAVFQDRLGTNRASGARFYPYGDEVASTANDHEKFATYTRDSYTGLDYADQRFYASTYGRFDTTDPGYAGALSNPQSLNLYSYVLGDPVNGRDPQGLCSAIGGGGTESAYEAGTNAEQEFASEVGGIAIFPYSNGTYLGGYLNVALQGRDVPTGATLNWFIGLTIAAQTPGPISAYAFSGSAGAFTLAYNLLPSDIQSRITNITYIDPGSNGEPLTSGMPGTNVTVYSDNSDLANILVQLLGSGPGGNVTTVDTGACGHNSNCVYSNFAEQLSRTATSCDVGAGAVIGLPQRNYYTSSGGFDWSNFYWNPAPVPVVTETIHYDSL